MASALTLSVLVVGCATTHVPVEAPTPEHPTATPAPLPPASGHAQFTETGYASWYGRAHQGKLTSSGEPYDMNQLTAAHRTLPMGTRLLVTNLKNSRSVTVRVNDRGPSVNGRVVDLSYAAAREIDSVGDGVVPVSISVVSGSPR